jgi:ribosomal protein S18 acetylase RimI-like enzyme
MIEWLIDYASRHSIQKISLSASKDNYAINLYRQQGFLEYADRGDAFIMVREI